MSLNVLENFLEKAPQYQLLRKSLDKPIARERAQVLSNAASFTLAKLWQDMGIPVLVVTPRAEDSRRLHEQLIIWSDDEDSILHFPEAEILPFERLASDAYTSPPRSAPEALSQGFPEALPMPG